MINIRTINKLKNNEGLTLKKGKKIQYKTGWQVAIEGIECNDAKTAMKAIKNYEGNCGVWFYNGIYYIDKSFRVNTKHKALAIGKENNQISVYNWKNNTLAFC